MGIPELLLRIVLSFFVLFILMRIEGRKELTQMTIFNFVTSITIGSIAASMVSDNTFSILNGIIALTGWTLLTLIIDFIDIKSVIGRKIFTGKPLIIIKNGKIAKDAMRVCRLDANKLSAFLREKNIFSLSNIDYAIFETSGKLSVLMKEEYQPASKSDINKPIGEKIFPFNLLVISDGKIRKENLSDLDLDEKWVLDEIKKAGYTSPEEIFIAELQTDGSLYIDKY